MSKRGQYLLVAVTTVVFMYCVGSIWGLVTALMAVAISYCIISPAAQDGLIANNMGQQANGHRNQGQRGINGDQIHDHGTNERQFFDAAQKAALKTLLAQTRYPTPSDIDQLMQDDAFVDGQVPREKVVKWFSRINAQAKELLDEANEEIAALTQALGHRASL